MATTPQNEVSPQISRAAERYLEQYGDPTRHKHVPETRRPLPSCTSRAARCRGAQEPESTRIR